jgi:GAF domain-containing protein
MAPRILKYEIIFTLIPAGGEMLQDLNSTEGKSQASTRELRVNNQEILDSIQEFISSPMTSAELMGAVVSLLYRERPHYNWVGIYLLQGHELVLGPFVGKPTVHTRIPLHQGICGAAASTGETVIVDDVNADPRYLACSLETRSEIVVPIQLQGRVLGEIDIDSDQLAAFTSQDRDLLQAVATLLASKLQG